MECLMRSTKQLCRRQALADGCPLLRRMPEDRNGSGPVFVDLAQGRPLSEEERTKDATNADLAARRSALAEETIRAGQRRGGRRDLSCRI